MHCLTIQVKGVGDVYINHNGDWSGDAIIRWGDGKDRQEVVMPAAIFLEVSKRSAIAMVRDSVISSLEQID
jgi:hypothetical protein